MPTYRYTQTWSETYGWSVDAPDEATARSLMNILMAVGAMEMTMQFKIGDDLIDQTFSLLPDGYAEDEDILASASDLPNLKRRMKRDEPLFDMLRYTHLTIEDE